MIDKKKIVAIVPIIFIIVIILAIIIITLGNSERQNKLPEEEPINTEQLETNFNELFDNKENDYIKTLYNINETKSGKYNIEACVPVVSTDTQIDNEINKEINDLFVKKILQVIKSTQSYTVLKINYTTSFNNNIISLIIKCVLKEGSNAQRTIIKTYNYNLESKEIINIMDIIPEEKQEEIQKQINKKIENEIKKEETIIEQGYNVYRRNAESDIYILKNATEFFIKDKALYIIYSYGNNNYTSKVDIIITEI